MLAACCNVPASSILGTGRGLVSATNPPSTTPLTAPAVDAGSASTLASGSAPVAAGVSAVDLAFVGGFIAVALLIGFGGRYLSRRAYSRLLLLLALLMAVFIALYQYFDVSREPENAPVHATAMAFAQFGVYGLTFKIWLSVNYEHWSRHARFWVHLVSHASFALAIFAGYWMKIQHPAIALLIYPLNGLSLSLIAEAIENAREERGAS